MKILLTGKDGQVGRELGRALAPLGEVIALGRADLDLAVPTQIVSIVRSARPDVLVNAAAYTAVDRAQSEPDLAMQINGTAPGILAEEAKRLGALLIHYSTDYVFDGTKPTPYLETDTPNPINVYGMSKLAGERAVQGNDCRHLILRTSWVYGMQGSNFLLTMLRLAGKTAELRVVDDQIGAPTWCREIARATARIAKAAVDAGDGGLIHMTCAGATSWCGFARKILSISGIDVPVAAILSNEYPSAAKRPANSLLSNARLSAEWGISLPDWADSLHRCLGDNGAVASHGLP